MRVERLSWTKVGYYIAYGGGGGGGGHFTAVLDKVGYYIAYGGGGGGVTSRLSWTRWVII